MNSPSLCVKDVKNIISELKNFQKYYTEKFRVRLKVFDLSLLSENIFFYNFNNLFIP